MISARNNSEVSPGGGRRKGGEKLGRKVGKCKITKSFCCSLSLSGPWERFLRQHMTPILSSVGLHMAKKVFSLTERDRALARHTGNGLPRKFLGRPITSTLSPFFFHFPMGGFAWMKKLPSFVLPSCVSLSSFIPSLPSSFSSRLPLSSDGKGEGRDG